MEVTCDNALGARVKHNGSWVMVPNVDAVRQTMRNTGVVREVNPASQQALVEFDGPGDPALSRGMVNIEALEFEKSQASEPEAWTNERLGALCREWQGRLRLQDWDVRVSLIRKHNMELDNVGGECLWVLEKREADIHLLDPVDWHPLDPPQDVEKDLVHELLHLHFAPFMASDKESLVAKTQEQAIEAIAKSLVALKRAGEER